ncbi:MAG: tRNA (adenosine(37)-N6)-dimethylallyltransferase MiaA [Chitinophagaceae bacterium]|nr:tRNA (adenosine(37)-N6)-dimethylallyltransferase MiaA [Chitinophagaceae bacterium]
MHTEANNTKPLLVVVAGPTASGKTGLAIALAQHFDTEILSADSRQCYRELNIGVARPAPEELLAVPHHFIASHSIHHPVDAAAYEAFALKLLPGLFARRGMAIVAGGTGLYIKALLQGIAPMPLIPDELRSSLRNQYEKQGLSAMQQLLAANDPLFATTGEMQNPHRVLRALEVVLATGKSIRHFQQEQAVPRPFNYLVVGINPDKATLHHRINQRVDAMVAAGLEAEASALYPLKHLGALQTVGYQEFFNYFEGKLNRETAIEQIKIHTRQYAKRQLTWFNKQAGITWLHSPDPAIVISHVKESLPKDWK